MTPLWKRAETVCVPVLFICLFVYLFICEIGEDGFEGIERRTGRSLANCVGV